MSGKRHIWLLFWFTIYFALFPGLLPAQHLVFNDTVCPGDTKRYRVIGKQPENIVTWSISDGSILTGNPSADDTVRIQWPNNKGIYTLYVAESDTGFNCYGEIVYGEIFIGSDIKNTLSLGPDKVICEHQTIMLDAGQGYKTYLWSDGSIASAINVTIGGTYSVSATDYLNCSDADTVTITVNENPVIQWNVDNVCDNSGQSPDPGYFSEYLWSTGENTRYIMIPYNTNYVWVKVTNEDGCITTDTLQITDCFNAIPTAFSPNNDGINDRWEIPWLQYEFPDAVIYLFNRAGVLIFESEKGYKTPWDGRYHNIPLPIDSYHFILEHNDGINKPRIGQVTIIK